MCLTFVPSAVIFSMNRSIFRVPKDVKKERKQIKTIALGFRKKDSKMQNEGYQKVNFRNFSGSEGCTTVTLSQSRSTATLCPPIAASFREVSNAYPS